MLAVILLGATTVAAIAQHAHRHGSTSAQPYAGQQERAVAGLSPEDLQGFLDGRGMGLARSAELNGYPGPMHVLELADELQLTAEQRRGVEQAFQRMKAKATEHGGRYVAAERAVDAAFKSTSANAAIVAERVAEASRLLGEVRLSHLAAHLEITPLLTVEQRARYSELRGYAGGHGKHR
jgi:Spy/CpxP family protein refolding chaperone